MRSSVLALITIGRYIINIICALPRTLSCNPRMYIFFFFPLLCQCHVLLWSHVLLTYKHLKGRSRYPGLRVSPFCFSVLVDVSNFTRNFFTFSRGLPVKVKRLRAKFDAMPRDKSNLESLDKLSNINSCYFQCYVQVFTWFGHVKTRSFMQHLQECCK
jgi:hypothetical protein